MDYPKLRLFIAGACDESSGCGRDYAQTLTLLCSNAEAAKAEAELMPYDIDVCFEMGYYDLQPKDSEHGIPTVQEITERYF